MYGRKRQLTLSLFFSTNKKEKSDVESLEKTEGECASSANINMVQCSPSTSTGLGCEIFQKISASPLAAENANTPVIEKNEFDVGALLDKVLNLNRQMRDSERLNILENAWIPEMSYCFPASGKRNLKFQIKWLHKWKWLLYSKMKDSAFCRYCSLFSSSGAGKGSQELDFFVFKAFNNGKKAIEYFNIHENTEYHKGNILLSENFLKVCRDANKSIEIQQNSFLKEQVMKNREAILPIIKTVMI